MPSQTMQAEWKKDQAFVQSPGLATVEDSRFSFVTDIMTLCPAWGAGVDSGLADAEVRGHSTADSSLIFVV